MTMFKYTPQIEERAVRVLLTPENPSTWAAITTIAYPPENLGSGFSNIQIKNSQLKYRKYLISKVSDN